MRHIPQTSKKPPFRELFTANVYSRKALTDFH